MSVIAAIGRSLNPDVALARLARTPPKPWWASMLIGAAAATAVLAIRWAFSAFYQDLTGFMILLPGVILAALAAGRVAGLTAVVVCLIGGWLVVDGAAGQNYLGSLARVATVNFLIVGIFVTVVAASLRRTLATLAVSRAALDETGARIGRTEAELQAMVDQASAGIARVDLKGAVVQANARFAEILGLPVDKVAGIVTADVTHPEDIEPTREILRHALEAGSGGGQIEKRYIRPDGSVVWAITSLRLLTDPAGKPEGYIAVLIDITDGKLAEAALRESEQRFRLMADSAPAPVWLSTGDGRLEFVNAALVDFAGRSGEELVGEGWRILLHPDDRDRVEAVRKEQGPRGEAYGFDARFRRADGAWRWMKVEINPRRDAFDEFLGYVGMAFDTTETRYALEAVARQERRQSFLLDLTDRIRDLSNPEAIMAEVERALGDLLDVHRVGYGEVDQKRGVVSLSRDWTAGVASAQGQVSLHSVGALLVSELAEGRTVAVEDVRDDRRVAEALDSFERLQTRALIRAPLIRNGRLQAFLYVHSAIPRAWTGAEIELVEEVAARTWAEVERARAETEVRESEQRFRAIADTAPVLIWVTGQDRQREFVNQAYVAFMGGDYETVRTADWRVALHPEDQERILAESLAGEATAQPFSLEARYLRHDGVYRWLKSFSRPRFGGGGEVIGFVGVAFDVTDIREAQAQLAESEARFRTVADSAPALMWMTDENARLTFANRRYRSFFNARSESRLADAWLRMSDPEDIAALNAAFLAAFEGRKRFEHLSRVRHPVRGERWLRSEGVPRIDADGRFQGYVGASIDVTDAKQAEDGLRRINELLEERVSEALAEKAQAEADLMHAQRMEAVGRLTGGVAHDFNNLLTVVIGALDIILRSEDPAKRRKLGEAALAAARRGERLTHQLLAFSRRQALRPEAVDINALILESEPLLRGGVGEAVDFQIKLRRGAAWTRVDPAQFEAALLNLIVNARDALGDRGGRVTVQTLACSIKPGEVVDLTPGRYVCVSVSDNGEGMSPEVADKVFEPFFTTKAVGKGTGLGLSQVYGFARQSGGGVRVTSRPGKGAEFRLYLPPLGEDRAQVAEPSRSEPADASLAGASVLLVEDDPAVASIAIDILSGLDMTVRAVDTAPAALERLNTEAFDVMLTDVVMPGGMTGIELARTCAARHPAMRIILTSGYAGEDVDAALADTPWPFLRKPYSAEQLKQVLSDTVG